MIVQTLQTNQCPEFEALVRIYSASLPESECKSISALWAMIERPEYLFLVALEGGSVVGFTISIRLSGTDAALLEYFAIDPAHRNQGIGQSLFLRTASHEKLADRFL